MTPVTFILVVGVGRSGTSLLQSMLAAHSLVHAVPETSYLRRYVFANGRVKAPSGDDELLAFRVPSLIAHEYQGRISRRELFSHYVDVVSHGHKHALVVDKDPRLVEYLPLVFTAFSSVSVVHIYRDPRDVLVSKKNADWSKGRSLLSYLVASWVQLRDAEKASRAGSVISVKYENLIVDPETELRRLSAEVGVPFDAGMLRHTDAAARLVQDAELGWKKETLNPVNAANTGKWAAELSPAEALAAYWVAPAWIRSEYDPVAASFRDSFRAGACVALARAAGLAYLAVRAVRRLRVYRELR